MGEETCKDCRSWEEEIYWTHFQCTQFSQFLNAGFDHQLPIPTKFSKNLKKKLPEIVTLKGPSGSTWKVELTTNDDTMFFKHGWADFVKDHFLQEKDLLIFKYNGDSHFDVLMFDGQTMCERTTSYFVRKCRHEECHSSCQTKRKFGESSVEVTLTSPQDFVGGTPENCANNPMDTTPFGQPIISQAINKETCRELKFSRPIHIRQSVRIEEPSTSSEELETKPDIWNTPISSNKVHDVPYISSRRLVTEEEKHNALKLAQAAITDEGFIVVMKPTHVYRKFYMVIPSGWITRHFGAREKQDVILRIKENRWNTKFCYQKARNSGGLSGGWKNFAMDNKLQEFDVCVFEPGSPVNSVLLDVYIFRVVQ